MKIPIALLIGLCCISPAPAQEATSIKSGAGDRHLSAPRNREQSSGPAGKRGAGYSDANAYADGTKALRVGDAAFGGAKPFDRHSRVLADGLEGKGPGAKAFGVDSSRRSRQLHVTSPVLHSVTATTANLEWMMSGPGRCRIAWGETPECEHELEYDVNRFGSYSLTGLKPGTRYYFKILSITVPEQLASLHYSGISLPKDNAIAFTTETGQPEPRTLHVAADGDDRNGGLRRDDAWRSIQRAANSARSGDTVLVSAGTYREQVRIRASGDDGLPITFKSAPGERVVIDGHGRNLGSAFICLGKKNIKLDGFYFRDFGKSQDQADYWLLSRDGLLRIYRSSNVEISRCFYDGRGAGYSPCFLVGWESPGLVLRNDVVINGFHGIELADCAEAVVENCVIARCLITAFVVETRGKKVTLRRNIFTDNLPRKGTGLLIAVSEAAPLVEDENCYFLRVPEEERKLFSFIHKESGENIHQRLSLEGIKKNGKVSRSFAADPGFAIFSRKDLPYEPEKGYPVDALIQSGVSLDFADFFATNPRLLEQGIGLTPKAFQ